MMNAEKNDVVIIELDRPRELRCGHKVLKRFSALTGCSMIELDSVTSHYDKLAALLYVMLSADDPEITPEKADDLLDGVKLTYIIEKCGAALAAAFDDGEGDDTPPTAAGPGTEA